MRMSRQAYAEMFGPTVVGALDAEPAATGARS